MAQKVIFLQINKPAQKILKISQAALYHFQKKMPLCFLAPNDIAQKYVDELLWKEPLLSFVPHVSAKDPTTELIVISTEMKNQNQASHIFNLTTIALEWQDNMHIIYEFDDQTTPEKKALSQIKYKQYRHKNCIIELK